MTPTETKVINFSQEATSQVEQVAQYQNDKHLPKKGLSRAKTLLDFIPFGRTTLHEWSNDGRFPASIKLSPTMVAWDNEKVHIWLSKVADGYTPEQATKLANELDINNVEGV